jgi:diguanylate cyclase (GGDEF)-like protein
MPETPPPADKRSPRGSIAARLMLALCITVAAGLLGGLYAGQRLLATDAAYSRLLDTEAKGVLLVSRANLLVMNDARLLYRLVLEEDPSARDALVAERAASKGMLWATLAEARAALPRHVAAVDGFERRLRALSAVNARVEHAARAGDGATALRLLHSERDPAFAELRGAMRDFVADLDAAMDAASAAATRASERAWWNTLAIVAAAGVLSLLLAAAIIRIGVTRPLARLTARMHALALGDDASPVPGQERRDALGRAARALETFRRASLERSTLDRAAHTDPLTGLANRRAAMAALERAMARGQPVSVIAVDLDHFKQVNDAHGHAMGDAALLAAGERMRAAVRDGDLVARLGGDEFVAVLPGCGELEEAARIADRLRDALNTPLRQGATILPMGATLGVATARGGDPADLLRRADLALMSAKRAGRGCVGQAGARAA